MPSLPVIYYIIVVISILAIITTLFFWVTSFMKKIPKTTIHYFLLHLSVITAFLSLAFCLNWIYTENDIHQLFFDYHGLCITQSVINIFSTLSSEFWISVIVYRFYYEISTLIKRINSGEFIEENFIESYESYIPKISLYSLILCICISYGIPLLLIIIMGSLNVLGKGSVVCWIDSTSQTGEIWKLLTVGFRGINIFFSLVISFLIIKIQKGNNETKCSCSLKGKNIKILIIPLIQLFGAIPPLIYRIIYNIDKHSNALIAFRYIDPIVRDTQGIFYPLFFAYISGIYDILCSKNIKISQDVLLQEI